MGGIERDSRAEALEMRNRLYDAISDTDDVPTGQSLWRAMARQHWRMIEAENVGAFSGFVAMQ